MRLIDAEALEEDFYDNYDKKGYRNGKSLIVCAVDHKKEQRYYERRHKQLIDWLFGSRTERWKSMGAYEAPEKGQLYLDLEGIRLVIENGEIEGWYIP